MTRMFLTTQTSLIKRTSIAALVASATLAGLTAPAQSDYPIASIAGGMITQEVLTGDTSVYGRFKEGTKITVLGGNFFLSGEMPDGSIGRVYLQIGFDGAGNIQIEPSVITGTLPVEEWSVGPGGGQVVTETPADIPSNPAQPGGSYDYGQSIEKRGTVVLATALNPVSACKGGNTEWVLDAYNEYSYGVVWCPNSTPPNNQKSVKKNYHYLFNNGAQVLVLTMNFSCATDTAAMPEAAQFYCAS